LAESYSQFNIDLEKGFLLGSQGTGGSDIALAIAHLYIADKLAPPITGLYIACPQAMNQETVPEKYKDHLVSMEQNAKGLIFTAESVQYSNCKLSWFTSR
jgi:hypothetical protein